MFSVANFSVFYVSCKMPLPLFFLEEVEHFEIIWERVMVGG